MSKPEFVAELVDEAGVRHSLLGEMRVGRSDECEIKIDDAKVSRKHAVFRVANDVVTVEDLGSANGTMINGTRADRETRLGNGDKLQFEKHAFTLCVTVPESEQPDSDATVVNVPDDDATVVSDIVSKPEPEPPPPPAAPSDLPGSWVDEPGTGEHTQVMDFSSGSAASSAQVQRMSQHAHLVVLNEAGAAAEGIELEPAGGSDPDVWEIGRDQDCELSLADDTVSARHAQLVHDDGRWSIVNLVAVNGIFVNGEKRLKAFLSDEDVVQLGNARLVFRAPEGAANAAARSQPDAAAAPERSSRAGAGSTSKMVIAVVILLALGAAGFLLLG